ncbi:hypothetical protein [Arthrobacter sp. efr-133-R2A-120]|uniref:hypothetical protein n=1 Tax=Arthrobacter sp. efr-133-R2A-120 TaxID=3040277 RepID=UPI00254C96E6|nr:hypothetical protein [Arthrobacter sp. efr-133-R2A-120]
MSTSFSPEVPAALNWEEAWVDVWRTEQLVVLVLPTSTSTQYGTQPVSDHELLKLAEMAGFKRLSRSGRIPDNTTTWKASLSSGGLHIWKVNEALASFPIGRLRVGSGAPHVEAPAKLVITRQSPTSYRGYGDLFRNEAGGAVGGVVTLMRSDLQISKQRRYYFVDSNGRASESVAPGSSVLIDQSILIDAERVLTNMPNEGMKLENQLRDCLAWLQRIDCIPGLGICECALGPTGADGGRRLMAAWEAWMTNDPISAPLTRVRATYLTRLDGLRAEGALQDLEETPTEGRLEDLNYLALLESLDLWLGLRDKPFVPSQRVDAYETWIDRMNTPDLGMSGHIGFAVSALLLARGKDSINAAGLLKIAERKPSLARLRGAAFDLAYHSIGDMITGKAIDLHTTGTVHVATADRLMSSLRARTILMGMVGDVGILIAPTPYLLQYSKTQARRILAIQERLAEGAQKRAERMVFDGYLLSDAIRKRENALLSSQLVRK